MVNRNYLLLAGLALVVAGTGCKNREAQLEGKWKASDINLPKDQSNAMANAVKSMLGSITLEFKPDKTYAMSVPFLPVEGTWTLSGNTVSMTMTKMMGMDMSQVKSSPMFAQQLKQNPSAASSLDKPQIASLSDDGKTLTLQGQPGSGNQQAMTFTKEGASGGDRGWGLGSRGRG